MRVPSSPRRRRRRRVCRPRAAVVVVVAVLERWARGIGGVRGTRAVGCLSRPRPLVAVVGRWSVEGDGARAGSVALAAGSAVVSLARSLPVPPRRPDGTPRRPPPGRRPVVQHARARAWFGVDGVRRGCFLGLAAAAHGASVHRRFPPPRRVRLRQPHCRYSSDDPLLCCRMRKRTAPLLYC